MPTERQLQETLARCVATMVFYHNCGRSRRSTELMAAEVQVVAGFAEELELSAADVETVLVRPLESELIERYGHEVGPRLVAEFITAFDGMREVDGQRRKVLVRDDPRTARPSRRSGGTASCSPE